MALDKLVDSTQLDADLTSVANAIRAKGGTSAQLAFPAGFVSAIGAILTGGGGGNQFTFSSYTLASSTSINTAINNAAISLVSQNEVLLWNVKGTRQQGSGSIGGKMGITVVQNGVAVSNSGMFKKSASVTAPDSMTPNTGNPGNATISIEDGKYKAGTGAFFNVGKTNTVEFIQIPYNVGWYVAQS